jgi:glycosyltransferase involved in cell wall biosynthesis
LRVLFDYQTFTLQRFGGISRYFCALARELGQLPDTWSRILAPFHINGHVSEAASAATIGWDVHRLPRSRALARGVDRLFFSPLARRLRPDLVHETYYARHATYRGRLPRVLTVFDMIHEKLPDEFAPDDPLRTLKAAAVKRADHVVCISESTRRDLLELIDVPPERVTVTYLSYDTLAPRGHTADALVGSAPYVLYVGARKGYKNFEGLVRAFAASTWLRNTFRIVCFGSREITGAERTLLAELGLPATQVIHIAGGDDRLAALYQGAAVFVYPSKYEGFGIPPLEAMSLGAPVIVSRSSSLPEVVGDAGEYFDAQDAGSLTLALERVLGSDTRRRELIELGSARCRTFSWERCARETHATYRTLVP